MGMKKKKSIKRLISLALCSLMTIMLIQPVAYAQGTENENEFKDSWIKSISITDDQGNDLNGKTVIEGSNTNLNIKIELSDSISEDIVGTQNCGPYLDFINKNGYHKSIRVQLSYNQEAKTLSGETNLKNIQLAKYRLYSINLNNKDYFFSPTIQEKYFLKYDDGSRRKNTTINFMGKDKDGHETAYKSVVVDIPDNEMTLKNVGVKIPYELFQYDGAKLLGFVLDYNQKDNLITEDTVLIENLDDPATRVYPGYNLYPVYDKTLYYVNYSFQDVNKNIQSITKVLLIDSLDPKTVKEAIIDNTPDIVDKNNKELKYTINGQGGGTLDDFMEIPNFELYSWETLYCNISKNGEMLWKVTASNINNKNEFVYYAPIKEPVNYIDTGNPSADSASEYFEKNYLATNKIPAPTNLPKGLEFDHWFCYQNWQTSTIMLVPVYKQKIVYYEVIDKNGQGYIKNYLDIFEPGEEIIKRTKNDFEGFSSVTNLEFIDFKFGYIAKANGIPSESVIKEGKKLDVTSMKEFIDQIEKHEENVLLQIDMKKATVVPAHLLSTAKENDVNLQLNMDGYSWKINSKDITSDNLDNINLEVKADTDAIDSNRVKEVAAENNTKQLSLTHNGEFGFKATLGINAGKENAGKNGTLYYDNKTSGKLEKVGESAIDDNGNVSFDFNHASDYVIVASDKPIVDPNQDTGNNGNSDNGNAGNGSAGNIEDGNNNSDNTNTDTNKGNNTTNKTENKTDNKNNSKTPNTGDNLNVVPFILVMFGCILVISTLVYRKKYNR